MGRLQSMEHWEFVSWTCVVIASSITFLYLVYASFMDYVFPADQEGVSHDPHAPKKKKKTKAEEEDDEMRGPKTKVVLKDLVMYAKLCNASETAGRKLAEYAESSGEGENDGGSARGDKLRSDATRTEAAAQKFLASLLDVSTKRGEEPLSSTYGGMDGEGIAAMEAQARAAEEAQKRADAAAAEVADQDASAADTKPAAEGAARCCFPTGLPGFGPDPDTLPANRDPHLDNCKFVLLVGVMLQHMYTTFSSDYYEPQVHYSSWVVAFNACFLLPISLPMFVLLSGMSSRGYPNARRQQALMVRVLAPTVLCSLLWGVWNYFNIPNFVAGVSWYWPRGAWPNPVVTNYPEEYLWYLGALFSWRVFSMQFYEMNERATMILAWVVSCWSGYWCSRNTYDAPDDVLALAPAFIEFDLAKALAYLPLFVVGFKLDASVFTWLKTSGVRIISITLLIVWFCVAIFEQKTVGDKGITGLSFYEQIVGFQAMPYRLAWTNVLYRPLDDWTVGDHQVSIVWARRFVSHMSSMVLGGMVISLVPDAHTFFTDAGRHSLYGYVLHVAAFRVIQAILYRFDLPVTFPLQDESSKWISFTWVFASFVVVPVLAWVLCSWPFRWLLHYVLEPTWLNRFFTNNTESSDPSEAYYAHNAFGFQYPRVPEVNLPPMKAPAAFAAMPNPATFIGSHRPPAPAAPLSAAEMEQAFAVGQGAGATANAAAAAAAGGGAASDNASPPASSFGDSEDGTIVPAPDGNDL
mmetsp:Transcript_16177/g.52881  ORF Transcript_16177/g.52881 Transcript_16177/m.52881 type:complete len:749 (-) Transcript_16177:1177-3423(-)